MVLISSASSFSSSFPSVSPLLSSFPSSSSPSSSSWFFFYILFFPLSLFSPLLFLLLFYRGIATLVLIWNVLPASFKTPQILISCLEFSQNIIILHQKECFLLCHPPIFQMPLYTWITYSCDFLAAGSSPLPQGASSISDTPGFNIFIERTRHSEMS